MARSTTQYEHVMRGIDELRPFGKNARVHGEVQVAKLARAIKEWGFTNALIIDEKNCVLAGYGRLMAARELPLTHVPCIIIPGLTTAQKRALALSDNRLALESSWDQDILIETLGDIATDGLDTTITGFDAAEIELMLSPAFEDDPEDKEKGEPALAITVTVASAIELPSVAAILRKAIKSAGLRGVKVREPR